MPRLRIRAMLVTGKDLRYEETTTRRRPGGLCGAPARAGCPAPGLCGSGGRALACLAASISAGRTNLRNPAHRRQPYRAPEDLVTKQRAERPTSREVDAIHRGKKLIAIVRATVLEMRYKHSDRAYRMPWAEVFDYLRNAGQQRIWTEMAVKPSTRGRKRRQDTQPLGSGAAGARGRSKVGE